MRLIVDNGIQMNEATHMATNHIKTVSDSRDQKARMSGDYEAYAKDQAAIRFQKARKEYLQNNPEVGTLIRNGKEVFYRNLQPLHLSLTEEFTPESVISWVQEEGEKERGGNRRTIHGFRSRSAWKRQQLKRRNG